jgi:hypothetical protein
MKNIILMMIFLLVLGAKAGFAQSYMLTKSVLAKRVDINGDSLIQPQSVERLEARWLLNVVTETKDFKVFYIVKFKEKKGNTVDLEIVELNKRVSLYSYSVEEKGIFTNKRIDNYFKLTNAEFTEVTTKLDARWTFGTVILPLKLRFGDTDSQGNNLRYFDFTSEVNIGLSVAWRMTRANTRTIDNYFFWGLNLTSIPVDSANTHGFQKTKTNASAISPTFGTVINFKNSGLQLIGTIGYDFMAGELGRKWTYRNQPWIGIGVGFSIFKFGDKGIATEQDKKK